ncbi:diguanylate cyclase [Lysobacter sp. MMG2]|nr:sensor domain-containing diguanylate cyclase [Lysobacter sp. MMG2]MBU8978029.1 diguanylate cyclase [Lysobacter sp. MMG2]
MRRPSRGSNVSERGRTDHAPLRLQTLAGRVYPFRILGMGLGVVPVMLVLYELQAHPLAWAWTVFSGYAWPHLAWLHARTARDPNRAELPNLTFDSMIAGSLVPLMHFTVLPSVVLLTVATADKVNSGVRGLWLRSLVGMGVSLLAMGLVTGFAVRAHTSMPVLLACLPILVVHTLAVSLSTYRLIRHVQKQNTRLDELSRFDALTGLESRRHWQEQASALLQRHRAGADSATLLLVDIDHFKAINDRCGHATGDDVLRGIADVIRHAAPVGSHAGRLGGDEFAIALSVPVHEAHVVAEEIRAGVATLGFAEWPELRCTVSVGVATPPPDNATLRDWTEAADRALYRAKAQGRNVVIAAVEALPG